MIQVEKVICSKCGKESYNENEFEFCIYCDVALCDSCVKYEYVDDLKEPVCEKCQ